MNEQWGGLVSMTGKKYGKRSVEHLAIINENDEYGTPKKVAELAFEKYNIHPEIDVFASDINHVLDKYWTVKDNAFSKKLTVDGFANIAYSKAYACMEYLYDMHITQNLNIIILCYSKTDTDWWQDFVYNEKHDTYFAEIKGINKRIRFLDSEGIPMVNKDPKSKSFGKPQLAPYPNSWIIYRKDIFSFKLAPYTITQ